MDRYSFFECTDDSQLLDKQVTYSGGLNIVVVMQNILKNMLYCAWCEEETCELTKLKYCD